MRILLSLYCWNNTEYFLNQDTGIIMNAKKEKYHYTCIVRVNVFVIAIDLHCSMNCHHHLFFPWRVSRARVHFSFLYPSRSVFFLYVLQFHLFRITHHHQVDKDWHFIFRGEHNFHCFALLEIHNDDNKIEEELQKEFSSKKTVYQRNKFYYL